MEDFHTGKHCEIQDCNYLDYLPYKCNTCKKYLCKTHYHNEYSCSEYIENQKNVFKKIEFDKSVCDFCKQIVNKNLKEYVICEVCKGFYCWNHRIQSSHECKNKKGYSTKSSLENRRKENFFFENLKKLKKEEK